MRIQCCCPETSDSLVNTNHWLEDKMRKGKSERKGSWRRMDIAMERMERKNENEG